MHLSEGWRREEGGFFVIQPRGQRVTLGLDRRVQSVRQAMMDMSLFAFVFFKWPHKQHMEVSRPGTESEPQL